MSKYLIKTTETYRADTEAEANELIERAKKDPKYEVTKCMVENKVQKSTEDEWKRVTLTKVFCDEKEPFGELMPIYSRKREEEDED